MSSNRIASVKELVRILGGPTDAAEVFGTTPQNIIHWQVKDRIPAKFYRHRDALVGRQIEVPLSLWGFVEPMSPTEAQAE